MSVAPAPVIATLKVAKALDEGEVRERVLELEPRADQRPVDVRRPREGAAGERVLDVGDRGRDAQQHVDRDVSASAQRYRRWHVAEDRKDGAEGVHVTLHPGVGVGVRVVHERVLALVGALARVGRPDQRCHTRGER